MHQVFIIVMFFGCIWGYFYLPETKGRTLEEMAVVFGDDEDVVVYMKDIHVDHTTHELIVEKERARVEHIEAVEWQKTAERGEKAEEL